MAVAKRRVPGSIRRRVGGRARWLMPVLMSLLPSIGAAAAAVKSQGVDYEHDVQPLFDRYCVACHACFDAPCQLDLTNPGGVARGASKQAVYDGARLDPAPPTRLFIDAVSTDDWRDKGFFPVIGDDPETSLLLQFVSRAPADDWRIDNPLSLDHDIGISRRNQCIAPGEFGSEAAQDPHLRMPFALPPLPSRDRQTLQRWIAEGAALPAVDVSVPAADRVEVRRWEQWLNQEGAERRLLSRWLFEHWAVARFYFDGSRSNRFYRIVRSSTPPGEPVREIATRRPNDEPGTAFHYRLLPQAGTRVYKTHITFPLSAGLRRRIDALFFEQAWRVDHLPGYSDEDRANPFVTFAAIPAEARYRFMLEHAGYFVRTFIRGPVCRGQLATDVIRDQFWVMFQTPESDPYVNDAAFRQDVDPLLALPGLEEDLLEGAQRWIASTEDRNRYAERRGEVVAQMSPDGASLEQIWNGDGRNTNALLTVFRHHDSATVKRGWLGQQPLTVWWLDFPLFERSYYNLVINFDVFGNIAHQAQTWLYFDLIRNGAEQNFLRLLPGEKRADILDSWYAGTGKLKRWIAYHEIDTERPVAVAYRTDDPQREILGRLLARFASINDTPDPINRDDRAPRSRVEAELSVLSNVSAADMPVIEQMPEASLLRVYKDNGEREVFTLIRNRRHTNVAFVLGESLRYESDKDTLTVVRGIATGYPNFIFNVRADDVPRFVRDLRDTSVRYRQDYLDRIAGPWGVRRTSSQLWQIFHDINAWMREREPLEAGMLDLNRYAGD